MPVTVLNNMPHRVVCFALLATQLIFSSVANAQQAEKMLERMSRSFHEVSYDGIIAYQHGKGMGSVRVVHFVADGKESERLIHLDGEPREIMRREHDINCLHTGDGLLLGSLAPTPFLHKRQEAGVATFAQNYQLSVAGKSRIAGRSATRLTVSPKGNDRFSYELYLDEVSGLLLKSETKDALGAVLESAQFTSLNVGEAVAASALSAESSSPQEQHYHKQASAQSPVAVSSWSLAWLPTGFLMSASGSHHLKKANANVEALHYTDGLAFFSVFIESVSKASDVYQQTKGSTSVYTLSRQISGRWYDVTVVGTLPLLSAVKVAQNLKLATND